MWAVREMTSEKSFNSEVSSAGSGMVKQLHHDSKLEGLIPASVGSARDDFRKKFQFRCGQCW